MASLATAIREIAADLATLPGLSEARDTAVERAPGFPLLMVYPGSGFWRNGAAAGGHGASDVPMRWGTHSVRIVVHVARKDLPYDIEAVTSFVDSVANAIMHGYHTDKFNGAVVCLSDPSNRGSTAPLTYQFGPAAIGAQDTVAVTFSLDITVEEEIN